MAYSPNPKSTAARFVVQTVGIRIIVMSTSGVGERISDHTQSTIKTAAAPNMASTVGSFQPHVGPYETPKRPTVSQPDMSAAPSQLMPPGARTGDAGMNLNVVTAAPSERTSGIQNSQ